MILWPQPDGTVLGTPQPAHALISGQLMRALADPPDPFEPVCTAAAQHDCAWLPWETAPEYDPATGLPFAFNALTGAGHVGMWEDGVRTALAGWGLWVGLLVLRHGTFIYGLGMRRETVDAEGQAAMRDYVARATAWSAELIARIGTTEAAVAANAARIAMVDGIALSLCWGQPRFDCGATTLIRTGDFAATLDPWPLRADRLEVETEALLLPARFADAAAMRAGAAAAPRRALRFTLTRP